MSCDTSKSGLGFMFHTPGLGPQGGDMTPKEATSLKAITDKYPELWEGNLSVVICLGCGGLRYNKALAGGAFYEDPEEDLKRPQFVRDPKGITPVGAGTVH